MSRVDISNSKYIQISEILNTYCYACRLCPAVQDKLLKTACPPAARLVLVSRSRQSVDILGTQLLCDVTHVSNQNIKFIL